MNTIHAGKVPTGTETDGPESRRPRISVLLPTRDALSTLPRAVASVQRQTLTDWELVVVDDGSSDGTAAWLADVARHDPRVRWRTQPHGGIVAALNAGLAIARADWVARMDADDECLPDRLACQWDWAAAHPECGVVGSWVEFAGDPVDARGYAEHVDWLNTIHAPRELGLARFVESPLAHPSVLFRRECVRRFGGYRDGPFPEDYELWLRWWEGGVVMGKVPRVLLRWHDGPGRLSRRDPRYATEAFYRVKAGYLARWLRSEVPARRPVWIWGAGRVTRRRVDWLLAEGVRVEAYIDIDPRKHGTHRDGRRVVGPSAWTRESGAFVVGYVGKRGAREQQREFLEARGGVEGEDFIFAA